MPPAARRTPSLLLAQGYLPGEALVERVRRVRGPDGDRFVRTVKLGAGAVRTEVEEETTPELFAALWRLTRGRRVRKRRHVVADGARTWEIDRFLDRDLVLAEIELESADAPVAFPAWLAPYVVREVTDDGAYTNARLAR